MQLTVPSGLPVRPIVVRTGRDCVWAQYAVLIDDLAALLSVWRDAGITPAPCCRKLLQQSNQTAGCALSASPHTIQTAQRVRGLLISMLI